MAKKIVNPSKLRVNGTRSKPHATKFSIRATIGTIAMLIPIPSATF